MKTAILYVTHICNEKVIAEITKLYSATKDFATLYVVYQSDLVSMELPFLIKSFPFTIRDLNLLEYRAWGCTIMDGNCHFIFLNFYHKFPMYDYYWVMEYDVRFNGNWRTYFSFFERKDDDFISAHIENVEDNPYWGRWKEIELYNINTANDILLKSFNPICRLSNKAFALLHERCKLGDRGHFEVLMPTIFNYYSLKISDFGGKGRFTCGNTQNLFYVDDVEIQEEPQCTHRVSPVYSEEEMKISNMIYHPIK